MKLYKTVEKEASASQIIEKSKFITYVKPVSSKEEADALHSRNKEKTQRRYSQCPGHGNRR